jgi:probable rRNA maturation factor
MIEINNLSGFKINKKNFSTVAKKVLLGENERIKSLSLAFVDKEEIKKLNKKYRGKNKSTDVLSFGEDSKCQIPNSEFNYLGEVVICPAVVKENAKKYGAPFSREIIKVFVHGILHLLGYDHEASEKEAKEMEAKEKHYLSIL